MHAKFVLIEKMENVSDVHQIISKPRFAYFIHALNRKATILVFNATRGSNAGGTVWH